MGDNYGGAGAERTNKICLMPAFYLAHGPQPLHIVGNVALQEFQPEFFIFTDNLRRGQLDTSLISARRIKKQPATSVSYLRLLTFPLFSLFRSAMVQVTDQLGGIMNVPQNVPNPVV